MITLAIVIRLLTIFEFFLLLSCGTYVLLAHRDWLSRHIRVIGWCWAVTLFGVSVALAVNALADVPLNPGTIALVVLAGPPAVVAAVVSWRSVRSSLRVR